MICAAARGKNPSRKSRNSRGNVFVNFIFQKNGDSKVFKVVFSKLSIANTVLRCQTPRPDHPISQSTDRRGRLAKRRKLLFSAIRKKPLLADYAHIYQHNRHKGPLAGRLFCLLCPIPQDMPAARRPILPTPPTVTAHPQRTSYLEQCPDKQRH